MVDIKTVLDSLNVELKPPRYLAKLDAKRMIVVGTALAAAGYAPRVTTRSSDGLTIEMSSLAPSGLYCFRFIARGAGEAEKLRSELEMAIYMALLRRRCEQAQQTVLPGFDELVKEM